MAYSISEKSCSTSECLPVFYGGDLISGSVTLDLMSSQVFKSIMVKVTGRTSILAGQEERQFLVIEKELWSSVTALAVGSKVSKLEKGHYAWPFEYTLPKEVEVLDQKEKKIFPLPPSFAERASSAYINYRITVFIRRGALAVNQSLYTEFAYVPITKPDLPSPRIQMAYTEDIPLVGPEVDPEGWCTLPPTSITGTLFDTKPVDVQFTLALTKPLSYACGSAIPLRLTFMAMDAQALDVLSTLYAPHIILKRSLDVGCRHVKTQNFVETMARAVFWAVEDGSTVGTRILEGEVKLKKNIKQSIVSPLFTVRYYLEVIPFEVVGFKHTPPVSGPLLTQPVNITSSHATGIFLRSFAPPEYAQEQYGNSIGLLDNGEVNLVM